MKALVLKRPGELVLENCPVPEPKEGELLIKTTAATICTSDLNDIRYNPFGIQLPMIMGHEGAGIVVRVGEGVSAFKEGDRVTVHPAMPCGKCEACRRGLTWLCDDLTHLGLNTGGTFAEYFTIRADRARLIPEGMDNATASLMEPICVCLEAIHRGQISEQSNVLVIGDGPFGIMMTKLISSLHPKNLVIQGRHEFRLNFVENAAVILETQHKDIKKAVLDCTNGEGIDCAILCVGSETAVETGIDCLRARGNLVVFSAVNPAPPVNLFKVHVKELNILGACNDEDYLDEALELLSDEKIGLSRIITHKLDFAQWEQAFHLAAHGKDQALKVTMLFE